MGRCTLSDLPLAASPMLLGLKTEQFEFGRQTMLQIIPVLRNALVNKVITLCVGILQTLMILEGSCKILGGKLWVLGVRPGNIVVMYV